MTTEDIEAYSNPVRLSVATRESGSAAGPSTSTSRTSQQLPLSERERLLKARKSNEIVRRKGEKWADKLMEETVDRETFKKALRYITSQSYLEITSERHLNNLCSYPLCEKKPLAPYNPNKRFRISTTNRTITEVQGNKEEGYCNRACRVKSEWVRRKLEESGSVLARGKGWGIELVEDLDLDLEEVSSVVEGRGSGVDKDVQSEVKSGGDSDDASRMKNVDMETRYETMDGTRRQSTTPLSSNSTLPIPKPPLPPTLDPTDLIANLHIHERPTPSSPAKPIAKQPPHNSISPSISPAKSKRAPTSILGEQSKLAQTVLKASKAINPIPQINPDSEEEEEHEEVEWEKEVGLGWGDDVVEEGAGDLWQAMRAAQEMAGNE